LEECERSILGKYWKKRVGQVREFWKIARTVCIAWRPRSCRQAPSRETRIEALRRVAGNYWFLEKFGRELFESGKC